MELHDHMVDELFALRSVAAFFWLIDRGRELECSHGTHTVFISKDGSSATVSLWCDDKEQPFPDMESLWQQAQIGSARLCDIWRQLRLETLF